MNKSKCFVLVLLTALSCSLLNACSFAEKVINFAVNEHPVCKADFEAVEDYWSGCNNEVNVSDDKSDLNLVLSCDNGEFIMSSSLADNLNLSVLDSEQNSVCSYNIKNSLQLSFYSFSSSQDERIFGLANDEKNMTYIAELEESGIRSYLEVEDDCTYTDIMSTSNGFIISGSQALKVFDSELQLRSYYCSEGEILGVTVFEKSIFVVEKTADSVCIRKLDKNGCKVRSEWNLPVEQFSKFHYYDSVALYAKDESVIYVSTTDAIFQLDLSKRTSKTIVNVGDYGLENSPFIIYADETMIKALVYYYDVIRGKYVDCIAFFEPGTLEQNKTVITAAMLADNNYGEYFQYINRNNADFYICIDQFTELNAVDYAELLSNDSFDLLLFDGNNAKNLVDGDFLLNLSVYSSNSKNVYYDYYEYDIHAYFYNSDLWNKGFDLKGLSGDELAPELFANQTQKMLAKEYANVICNNYHNSGEISQDIISDYIDLCLHYSSSYFEEQPIHNEIKNGSFIYLNSEIHSIAEFYSVFCYFDGSVGIANPWGYDATVLIPKCYIGIASESENKDDCLKILEVFRSEEIQNSFELPVNSDCLAKKLDDFIADLDEETAGNVLTSYPLYSDGELQQVSGDIDAIIHAMEDGSHNEDMDSQKTKLPVGLRPLTDKKSLNKFGEFVFDCVRNGVERSTEDQELIEILVEEADSYISNGRCDADSDRAKEVLFSRVYMYAEQNWG